MFVVRCPACRRANVREPLVERAVALLQARDRVEAAKTLDDRATALAASRLQLRELQGELQRVREYLDLAERECDAAAVSERPAEFVPPTHRADPPPPEVAAFLARKPLAPPSPAAVDEESAPEPARRQLPAEIAARVDVLKAQLRDSVAPPPPSYRRLRASLGRLAPLLHELAQAEPSAPPWSAKLRELLDEEPFDRESARSFVEALAQVAMAWRRQDIGHLAVRCREELEFSLGIPPHAATASEAEAEADPVTSAHRGNRR